MKKYRYAIVLVPIVLIILFTYLSLEFNHDKDNNVKVYSISGENKDLRVSNGVIVINPYKYTIDGGNLAYLGDKKDNIEAYTKKLYTINEKGERNDLVYTGTSTKEGNFVFPDEISSNNNIAVISGEESVSPEELFDPNNLYFELEAFTTDGKIFTYTLKLNVKDITEEK